MYGNSYMEIEHLEIENASIHITVFSSCVTFYLQTYYIRLDRSLLRSFQ